jgi:hypothetical protein
LLEIPSLAQGRFGERPSKDAKWDEKTHLDMPLFWLAHRIGKNRERMGLHYPSDTSSGRDTAWSIRKWLLDSPASGLTKLATLNLVLDRAQGEWPLQR